MSNEVLERIKSRGYWHAIVRPERFIAGRVPTLTACQEVVESNQVRYRGRYFPHIETQHLHRGLNYIEVAVTAFGSVSETWRFYQSGQFALFRGLREDWMQEDTWLPSQVKPDIEPGTRLDILSTLFQLSEIYEFAARLAQAGIYDESLFLAVNLVHTKGRKLFFWPSPKYDFPPFIPSSAVCEIAELPKQDSFGVTDFIACAREYSFEHFLWLMERFALDVSRDVHVFKRDQEKFFEGRF
jgi:hypothetical protein